MRDLAPMQLLAAGVPLSLLLDLADPAGPDSRGIVEHERRAATTPARPRLAAVSSTFTPAHEPAPTTTRAALRSVPSPTSA